MGGGKTGQIDLGREGGSLGISHYKIFKSSRQTVS